MTGYRFQSVITAREYAGKCPVCGKRVVRRKRFEHTINPFNRNPDGSVRTAEEVRTAVEAEANEWVPDFTHEKCKGVTA